MHTSYFNNMPSTARAWVYMADKEFNESEIAAIKDMSIAFIDSWTSHGAKMKAELEVIYNRFIVLLLDETAAGASGCGIDKSVAFMKQLEGKFHVNLFNRMLVAYKTADEQIKIINFNNLAELSDAADFSAIQVFNNAITTKQEFEKSWLLPIDQSWVKEYVVHA
ncbi:MAG: ABC transporter ATPase [Bacteroidetes bacterium]|nr:ABC transporter ATPase [Bacteroidota bacterium]